MKDIEFERHIAAVPEIVYGYFTDPVKYTRWMGVEASLDPRPGGEYRVVNPNGSVASGRFITLEPHERIQFSWGFENDPGLPPGSSTVTVTFTPTDQGTHVRLVHTGLPTEEWRAAHEPGWVMYLDRLTVVSAGGDAGPLEG
jgi:uncharacterized protein YndB with AHSA1/START domain